MGAFGEPVVLDEQAAMNAATGDAPLEQPIDINDPALTSESLTVNPEADAYAAPPTLPEGRYRAKLKHRKVNDGKDDYKAYRDHQSGSLYVATALDASVISHDHPEWDGVPLTDYFVSTQLKRNGGVPAATVCTACGVPAEKVKAARSHADLVKLLISTLAAEPECVVDTIWEAQCQTCEEEAKKAGTRKPKPIRGMLSFPQNKPGVDAQGRKVMYHNPTIMCPRDSRHGQITARPRIYAYLPLSAAANGQAGAK